MILGQLAKYLFLRLSLSEGNLPEELLNHQTDSRM